MILRKRNGICSYVLLPVSWAMWKLRICSTESFSQYFLRPANDPVAGKFNHSFVIVSGPSVSCTALSTIVLLQQIIYNWFSGFTLICYECWQCFLVLLHRMWVDFVANVSKELAAFIFSVSVERYASSLCRHAIHRTDRKERRDNCPFQTDGTMIR